jgi:integrase/recombinase XerD
MGSPVPVSGRKQARRNLDTPSKKTVLGLRDRTILSVGLQVGFRRAEITGLTVGDFHMNRGYESLRVVRKGGKKGSRAMHPQAAQRIRDYRVAASFFPSLHWDL